MQIKKMQDKHYEYLEEQFGIDKDRFEEICDEDGEELENLIDELTWKECDAVDELDELGHYTELGMCAIELIDIICGPYDTDQSEE